MKIEEKKLMLYIAYFWLVEYSHLQTDFVNGIRYFLFLLPEKMDELDIWRNVWIAKSQNMLKLQNFLFQNYI